MTLRRLAILLLSASYLVYGFAQKTVRVHGMYTYRLPENVSIDEGKRTALERAKIQALADAFGTLVSQVNSTVVRNENGSSTTDFLSIGGSNVKGEWLETVGDPMFDISWQGDMLVIKVEVDGRAREIKGSGFGLEAKLLRNGTDPRFESSEFCEGDDLYLYFLSPVDGYLAVYLLDETTEEVFCLLPYKGSGESAYQVVHDKPYVFFSAKKAMENPDEVDEYTLTCSRSVEQNTLYIIFSPNLFAKANASDEDIRLPRQLPLKSFLEWLATARTKDVNIQIINKPFKINHK